MNIVTLTKAELENLPEYSRSLPTGTTIGKQWRVYRNNLWYRGTYTNSKLDGMVEIIWERIWVASI